MPVSVLEYVGTDLSFLEQINQDYVRTARAKGLSELKVLFGHVLKNGMLPILTGVVVVIPSLFMGSLIMESFFGIPGTWFLHNRCY